MASSADQIKHLKKLLKEAGVKLKVDEKKIFEISCLDAVRDLKQAIDNKEPLDSKNRPQSIQNIIIPIQYVIREVILNKYR